MNNLALNILPTHGSQNCVRRKVTLPRLDSLLYVLHLIYALPALTKHFKKVALCSILNPNFT